MTLKQAVEILKQHNRWRQGEELPMQTPNDISLALQIVLDEIKHSPKLRTQNEQTNANT